MSTIQDPISFATALEKFIEELRKQRRSSATTIAYRGDLGQLQKYLDSHRITQATSVLTSHLQDYLAYLASKNYTPKSISRKINSFKTFFKFLIEQNLNSTNPALPLTHPKVESHAPRILTPSEYKAIRDASRLDIRISAIVELLLQTGMRIGELANLRMEDVKKNELDIRPAENNAARSVPLNHSAAAALQNYLNIRPSVADDHLFVTKTGHPLLIRNIRTAIDRYFAKAGIKGSKVNDLRHTFVAHQLTHGVEIEFLTKIVGHKRRSSTEKYLEYIKIPETIETSTRLIEL